jgi:beta-mannanase
VRALNVPIALSFGHEMNGDWYPWGTKQTTAAQFVAAWRHIHDLFALAGATNVVWVWNPNDIYPVPNVQLQTYYPGDAYVDWVGVTGYWTPTGPHTYATLYLPTLLEIRNFTTKPFIIAETSVEAGANQESSVNDLFQAIESHPDIIGFVWYDYNRQGDWRIENRQSLLAIFKQDAAVATIGFDVK